MVFKKIILVILLGLFGLSHIVLAQEEVKNQAVFLEGFGSGIFYSFNYDWRFKDQPNGLGAKAGLGYTAIDGIRVSTIPLAANYLIGKKRNFLELGLGTTILLLSQKNMPAASTDPRLTASGLLFNGILGYRRVSKSGFLLRAGLTPFFSSDPAELFAPQVSIGYAF